MNTFFRQKLTNKTIDLLEKVEDKKAREEEEEHWCTYISFGDRVSHEVYSEKGVLCGRRSYYFYDNTGIFVNRICLILESDSGS